MEKRYFYYTYSTSRQICCRVCEVIGDFPLAEVCEKAEKEKGEPIIVTFWKEISLPEFYRYVTYERKNKEE